MPIEMKAPDVTLSTKVRAKLRFSRNWRRCPTAVVELDAETANFV